MCTTKASHSLFINVKQGSICLFNDCLLSPLILSPCVQLYLLAGYYYTATEEYDIKWTMPHCVLTLKLIGELANGSLYSPLLCFLIVLDGTIMLELSVVTISLCEPLTSPDKLLTRPLLGLRCWNDNDIIGHPNSCTFWLQVCRLIIMMAGGIRWVSGFCLFDHSSICWYHQPVSSIIHSVSASITLIYGFDPRPMQSTK